jgi:transcription termination factor Rho
VTETIEPAAAGASSAKKRGGLNAMLLADLKAMAGGMGISGAGSMKKAQLIDAIKAAQSGGGRPAKAEGDAPKADTARARRSATSRGAKPAAGETPAEPKAEPKAEQKAEQGPRQRPEQRAEQAPGSKPDQKDQQRGQQKTRSKAEQPQPKPETDAPAERPDGAGESQDEQSRSQASQQGSQQGNQGQAAQGQGGNRDADGEGGSRRNRRRRGRDRDRDRTAPRPAGQRGEPDTEVRDDDVLVPAAGILDVLDNYAFVRTSGYLPGADDVYVSLSMVRKLGLRRGDAITGQVRQPREGERREKFNPMVRIDTVNGADPSAAQTRVEFSKLTPLYANERLRMETDAANMIGRVIDIAAPIGKGQRGLIVSPAKAGKTMIMQSIANSITTNNPECHLMVVLVDERPEEVTDFERSVKGEVISSTFDRPASDHTVVAELAIERAKRLVELGHDVVVLLDGITRLGRAYNLAAPASGRILSGGVDSAALYPPKRFFGAARNIENGGSLTILATALIESGSKMDEVIFEEFKGTGNMEIRLRRDFAEKRIFPAIDAVQSGTRREELLMSKEELAIVWKLRRVLSALDGQQSLELLLERLKKTQSNVEFLMQVQKTTPGSDGI